MIKGYPKEVRTSWIKRFFWCAEESRLLALNPREASHIKATKASERGVEVHRWLEQRTPSPSERKVRRLISAHQPIYRILDGTRIFAHPDEFRVFRKSVKIVEHKSIDCPNWTKYYRYEFKNDDRFLVFDQSRFERDFRYVVCCARAQVQVYCWVLEPFLAQFGYRLAPVHWIIYRERRDFDEVAKIAVEFNREDVESMIREIFAVWAGKKKAKPPAQWKCKGCHPYFKVRCSIRNDG